MSLSGDPIIVSKAWGNREHGRERKKKERESAGVIINVIIKIIRTQRLFEL